MIAHELFVRVGLAEFVVVSDDKSETFLVKSITVDLIGNDEILSHRLHIDVLNQRELAAVLEMGLIRLMT
jgi:hypothetical protein